MGDPGEFEARLQRWDNGDWLVTIPGVGITKVSHPDLAPRRARDFILENTRLAPDDILVRVVFI